MSSIPEAPPNRPHDDPDPMLVLQVVQSMRNLLEQQHAFGYAAYQARADHVYRRLRAALLIGLRREPCLVGMQQTADRLFPSTLVDFLGSPTYHSWDDPTYGRSALLVRFQGDILTILENAGLTTTVRIVGAGNQDASTSRSGAAEKPKPNRAQRNAAQRRERIRALRAEGHSIKVIAREVGCSERTVYAALQDAQ